MSPQEIKVLVKLMRKEGISILKTADVELVLNPIEPTKRKRIKRNQEPEPLLKSVGFKGYTDEQVLGWSSAPLGAEDAEDIA